MNNYLAFDRGFKAEITSVATIPCSACLWIDAAGTHGDQRKTDNIFSGLREQTPAPVIRKK